MATVSTYLRSTWANIATLGVISEVVATDTHYIEVRYKELTAIGQKISEQYPESIAKNILGDTIVGFSVTYKDGNKDEAVRREILRKATNIFVKHKVANLGLADMNEIFGYGQWDIRVDQERHSHAIQTETAIAVFYGREYRDEGWAATLSKLKDTYDKKIAGNRVEWFKWVAQATYVPHKSGDLFKMPNGLSIKFDNRDETITAGPSRIYCETWNGGEVNRFYNEAEFLTWLTRYF